MFQDSVPAGSYNDPFLSSVCVYLIVYLLYVFMYGSKAGSLPVADLW